MYRYRRYGRPEFVYHVAHGEGLEAARLAGEYANPSLRTEGFIHFSAHHQIAPVLDAFYPDQTGLVLLTVDPSRLKARLVWEKPSVPVGTELPAWADQPFPHLYGPLNLDAVVDQVPLDQFRSCPQSAKDGVHPLTRAVIDHFRMERLPVEGTLYASTWRSSGEAAGGRPAGTAMIGLYSNMPLSVSCFHRLDVDEVWHVYGGDPFRLILLHPDGESEDILMGTDPLHGQRVQFVVPAGTWQAGHLLEGGRYALFGCTMAPGFTGGCFEAGLADELARRWPGRAADIRRLSVNGGERRMPGGFAD
jgi:predicted cupin superfamily sugar epimerase/uncharacterized protein (DUF952 family)